MTTLVQQRLADLAGVCAARNVRRLDLFGAAARGRFDPDRSDLDFLVEFDEPIQGRVSDLNFGLFDDLAGLFGRPIDLAMSTADQYAVFRRLVDRTKVPVYGA